MMSMIDTALTAFRAGDVVLAESLAQKVLDDTGPDTAAVATAYAILGIAAAKRDEREDAERHFKTGLTAAPNDTRLLTNYAVFLERIGHPSAVVALLAKPVEAGIGDDKLALLYAKSLILIEAAAKAVPYLERLRPADPAPFGEIHGLLANAYLHSGKLDAAEQLIGLFDETLPEIIELRAKLLEKQKKPYEAIALINQNIDRLPDKVEKLVWLGQIYLQTEMPENAYSIGGQVLDLSPDNPDGHALRGTSCFKKSNYPVAHQEFSKAVALAPNNRQYFEQWLTALGKDKKTAELEDQVPVYLDRFGRGGRQLAHAATAALDAKLFDLALTLSTEGMERFPRGPIHALNAHRAHIGLKQIDQAEAAIKRALEISPKQYNTQRTYALFLADQGRYPEGKDILLKAVSNKPGSITPFLDLYSLARNEGHVAESIFFLRKALEKEPDSVPALYNLGYALLGAGELEQGFRTWVNRWRDPGFPSPRRPFKQRTWDGRPLSEGKPLLVWLEQGLGDEMMLAALLPMIRHLAPSIVAECEERLVPLMRRSFPDIPFYGRAATAAPELTGSGAAFKAPIGHVGQFCWMTIRDQINRLAPHSGQMMRRGDGFLTADPARVAYWRDYLAARVKPGTPLIGISWRGGKNQDVALLNYMTVEQFREILVPGAAYVMLQYTWDEAEIEYLKAELGDAFIFPEGIDLKKDIDECAALTTALDLVLSPGTAVMRLAGALGVPTWLFRSAPEGRTWEMLGTDFLPLLPSVRAFIRRPRHPWEPIIAELKGYMQSFIAGQQVERRYSASSVG